MHARAAPAHWRNGTPAIASCDRTSPAGSCHLTLRSSHALQQAPRAVRGADLVSNRRAREDDEPVGPVDVLPIEAIFFVRASSRCPIVSSGVHRPGSFGPVAGFASELRCPVRAGATTGTLTASSSIVFSSIVGDDPRVAHKSARHFGAGCVYLSRSSDGRWLSARGIAQRAMRTSGRMACRFFANVHPATIACRVSDVSPPELSILRRQSPRRGSGCTTHNDKDGPWITRTPKGF